MGGISGKEGTGVWSIALSGGYEDDFDEGYRFVYTGSGGRSTKVYIPPHPLLAGLHCLPPYAPLLRLL
jgi:hypothetical protein